MMQRGDSLDRVTFKGVIFDLDGTLVESSLDFQSIRQEIGCPDGVDSLTFIESQSPDRQAALFRILYRHEMRDAATAKWLGDAKEFVEYLHAQAIPMAIVTRNQKAAVRLKLENNRIPIDLVFTREDAKPKPDPSALNRIAQIWQLPEHKLVYVGDYLYDILTAERAKLASCLLAKGKRPDYAYRADIVITKLMNLAPHIEA